MKSTLYRKKRRAAPADQIAERRNDLNDGHGKPQSRKGRQADALHAADEDPVHHAVQRIDDLGNGAGNCQL